MLRHAWPVSLGFSGLFDDFAFFGVLAVDIEALPVIPTTDKRPPPINHGSNYQQNVNPGMFYSSDRSSDNFMGNLGSFVKFYGLMVHPLPAGRYSLGRHHAAARHGLSHLVFLAFLTISPSLVCLLVTTSVVSVLC
jgi:hypothetical protein